MSLKGLFPHLLEKKDLQDLALACWTSQDSCCLCPQASGGPCEQQQDPAAPLNTQQPQRTHPTLQLECCHSHCLPHLGYSWTPTKMLWFLWSNPLLRESRFTSTKENAGMKSPPSHKTKFCFSTAGKLSDEFTDYPGRMPDLPALQDFISRLDEHLSKTSALPGR